MYNQNYTQHALDSDRPTKRTPDWTPPSILSLGYLTRSSWTGSAFGIAAQFQMKNLTRFYAPRTHTAESSHLSDSNPVIPHAHCCSQWSHKTQFLFSFSEQFGRHTFAQTRSKIENLWLHRQLVFRLDCTLNSDSKLTSNNTSEETTPQKWVSKFEMPRDPRKLDLTKVLKPNSAFTIPRSPPVTFEN